MVQPVGATIDFFRLAGRDIVEKKFHRITLGETLFHHRAFSAALFVGSLNVGQTIRTAFKKSVRPVRALGDGAAEQCFVGVDRRHGLAARQREDFAGGLRLRVGRADDVVGGAVFNFIQDVINLSGLVADHDDVNAPLDDFFNFTCLEIDHRDSTWRGEDHSLSVGREWIHVEIEALAARLGRKLHDTVAGIGVNPFGGLPGVRRPRAGRNQANSGQCDDSQWVKTKCDFHDLFTSHRRGSRRGLRQIGLTARSRS
jgi:hypothetical protein